MLSREPLTFDPSLDQLPEGVELLTMHTTASERLILLNQSKQRPLFKVIDAADTSNTFHWLAPLQQAVATDNEVLIVVQNDPYSV